MGKIKSFLMKNKLINHAVNLRGNPAAFLWTEPLWTTPYQLILPFITVYMRELGLTDMQIGSITTIGLLAQFVGSIFSGVIVDKMGRKRATLVFDLLTWSVPCLIWAFAQDYKWFVAAALFSVFLKILTNAWGLLFAEDADPDKLVYTYSAIYVTGRIAVAFTPIAYILVSKYTVIPVMRWLYLLAFVFMSGKSILLNFFVTETRQGKKRMEETKNIPMRKLMAGNMDVIKSMLLSPHTLIMMGVMVVYSIIVRVNSDFWGLIVTSRIGLDGSSLSLFATLRSVVMMLCYFILLPMLSSRNFMRPMVTGFILFAISQLTLILTPSGAVWLVLLIAGIEAVAIAMLNPLVESLFILCMDERERSRIRGIMNTFMLLIMSPFGMFAGWLSELNQILPFVLNITLVVLGIGLTVYLSKQSWGKRMQTGSGAESA